MRLTRTLLVTVRTKNVEAEINQYLEHIETLPKLIAARGNDMILLNFFRFIQRLEETVSPFVVIVNYNQNGC